MNIKPLTIGNLTARLPIIQGGIGIISGAQPGYLEEDFKNNPLEANLRALKKHIKIAKEKRQN